MGLTLRVRQHQHSPETVVRHVISSIRTLLNPPDTPVFDLVARVVTECLPVTIIVTSVCGLKRFWIQCTIATGHPGSTYIFPKPKLLLTTQGRPGLPLATPGHPGPVLVQSCGPLKNLSRGINGKGRDRNVLVCGEICDTAIES